MEDRGAWCAVVHGVTKSPIPTTIEQQQQNETLTVLSNGLYLI